jgi:dipeptidyl aminopeptidase/acylaminoacyl peptidase
LVFTKMNQHYNLTASRCIIQGEKDNVIAPNFTHKWCDSLKELKMEHEYIEIPGGDHVTVIGDGMPDILDFFAAHIKTDKK